MHPRNISDSKSSTLLQELDSGQTSLARLATQVSVCQVKAGIVKGERGESTKPKAG